MKTLSKTVPFHVYIWIMVAVSLLVDVNSAAASGIQHTHFLPIIAQSYGPDYGTVTATGVEAAFLPPYDRSYAVNVSHDPGLTRLQRIGENGGWNENGKISCGSMNRLEVYGAYLIEVAHTDENGRQWKERAIANGQGGAKLNLYAEATVRVITSDGVAISPAMTVSTDPKKLPVARLIYSDYCTDATSCQQFVDADTCRGNFSWNIVFDGR